MEHRGAAILAPVLVVMLGTTLPGLMLPALAPAIRVDLPLDAPLVGTAAAVVFLSAAVVSPLAGHLVDRTGPRAGLHLAAGLSTLGALGIAAVARSPAFLLGLVAVTGVASALAVTAGSMMIRYAIRPARQGLALGVQQAGTSAAAAVAGLALPVIAVPLGWRWAFVAGALLTLLGALCVGANPPRPANAARRSGPGGIRSGPIVWVVVGAVLTNAAAVTLLAFLVAFAVDSGLSAGNAGALLTAIALCTAVARIGLGLWADRRRAGLGLVAALLSCGAAGFALLAAGGSLGLFAGAFVAATCCWGTSGLVLLSVLRHDRIAPGVALGWVLSGFFAGAVLGPLAAGFAIDRASFALVWWACAVASGLAAAATLTAHRQLQRGPRCPAVS